MRRMGFLGGSLIPRRGVLRGVGGGRGVGVGLFEEGGFLLKGWWDFFLIAASDFLFFCVVVEMMLNCDDSSIVVGRFFLLLFCCRHRLSFYVIVPCHFTAWYSVARAEQSPCVL